VSRITFGSRLVQRQPDDDPHDVVSGDLLEQLRHREAFSGAARESGERLGERLGFVRERETNPALAPVNG